MSIDERFSDLRETIDRLETCVLKDQDQNQTLERLFGELRKHISRVEGEVNHPNYHERSPAFINEVKKLENEIYYLRDRDLCWDDLRNVIGLRETEPKDIVRLTLSKIEELETLARGGR